MVVGEYRTIRVEVADGLARLTLARPTVLNALDRELLGEVIAALDALRDSGEARALLITAEGRAFCSGADLNSGGAARIGEPGLDLGQVLESCYNPIIERLFALPMPVISAVQGAAVGAGCMIALAADIVIAARSAYFLQAFANIGLVPDAGSTWLLQRLVGRARALAMMILAERISAEVALDWGLIYEVVDDEALEARGLELARKLASGPTRAYALIRQSSRASLDLSLTQALSVERGAQLQAGRTADFAEGVAAFREKRRPQFTGR